MERKRTNKVSMTFSMTSWSSLNDVMQPKRTNFAANYFSYGTSYFFFFLMTLEIGEFQGQVYLPACFIFYNVFSKKEQIGSLTVLHGRIHIFSFIGKMRQSVGARALVHGNCNVCFYQFYLYQAHQTHVDEAIFLMDLRLIRGLPILLKLKIFY